MVLCENLRFEVRIADFGRGGRSLLTIRRIKQRVLPTADASNTFRPV